MAKQPISFQKARERIDAEGYQLLEAEALLELFSRENGRRPTNMRELEKWAETAALPRPIDPFSVLTPEQIEQFKQKRKRGTS